MVRYLADGALDPTFGTGGKVITDFDEDTDEAKEVIFEKDGPIVVVGETIGDTTLRDIAVARYLSEPLPIFSDGFESGDTAAWSSSVP